MGDRACTAQDQIWLWDGSQYPSIDDAMAVIRVASSIIQENGSDSVKAAMLEVHLFVVAPTQEQRETAKAHAATARKGFLFGGLLHDCLSVILNVEHGCVHQMIYFAKEFARQHPEEVALDRRVGWSHLSSASRTSRGGEEATTRQRVLYICINDTRRPFC